MTARDVLDEYLAAHPEYDGLVDPYGECVCKRGDLAPCGGLWGGCVLGHVVPCDCGEHEFHVTPGPKGKE